MKNIVLWIEETLNRPAKVIIFSLVFVIGSLVFEGSLWRLYILQKEKQKLSKNIQIEKNKIALILKEIKRAKDPSFLEHQARERLELLEEDDLLFIFSDN